MVRDRRNRRSTPHTACPLQQTEPVNQVRTSKFLSLVLRHRPDKIGLTLDPAGWTGIDALLEAMAQHGHPITRASLEALVAESDKQRFVIDPSTDCIRANQGHSLDVDLGLPDATPPAVLYHGTPTRNLDSIFAEGVCKQARHAVHLSSDVETAHRVGARRGVHVVLRVEAGTMHDVGHRFSVSANGVWLTDTVPPCYLSVHASRAGKGLRRAVGFAQGIHGDLIREGAGFR